MIQEFTLKSSDKIKLPGVVPKLSATPGGTKWLGPELGEHTAEVLGQLGYDAAQQAMLRKKGVI
jgi:formyl-CoA transferase